MRSRRFRHLAVAGAAVLAAGALAGPAGAKSTNQLGPFAGYSAEPAGGVSSVGATFKVPKVTCELPTTSTYSLQLGVQMFDANDNPQAFAGILATCSGATLESQQLFVQTADAGEATTNAYQGDTVIAAAHETDSQTVATVTDTYTGVTSTDTAASQDTGAEPAFGTIALFDEGLTPKFSQINFTGVQVNGEHLGQLDPVGVNDFSNEVLLASAGGLTTYGQTFHVVFHHGG